MPGATGYPWPAREVRLPSTGRSRVLWQVMPFNLSLAAFLVCSAIFAGDVPLAQTELVSATALTGIGICVVATGLAAWVPWQRLPAIAPAVVPVLNLLALAVIAAGGLRVGLLAVLPALVLARAQGVRGAVVGTVLGTVAAWIDLVIAWEPLTQQDLPRLLLLPIVLATLSFSVVSLESAARARSALLARQDDAVRMLLDEQLLQRDMLEKVVASLPAGVLVLDQRGGVVMHNPQFERLVGLAPGEEALQPSELMTSVNDLARSGSTTAAPTRWWTLADGTRRALRSSVVHVSAPHGIGSHSVVLLEDLTMEESAADQREDFVTAISHELRTPLTSVLGYLDLLRDEDGRSASGGALIDVVERNSYRVLRLVEDLLVASSLKHRQLTLVPQQLNLCEVVRESLEVVAGAAKVARVRVEDRTQDCCSIVADRDRLAQVIINLLDNAITYSGPGGVVSVELSDRDDCVCLSISDQGIGMSHADAQRAFDRFFRAPSVVRTSRHGTGLGLHISREIVTGHGGEMSIESEPGAGTRVDVLLPRRMRSTGAAT